LYIGSLTYNLNGMKAFIGVTLFLTVFHIMTATSQVTQQNPDHDILMTDRGEAELYFIGHGTLMIKFNGKVIHIDPYSAVGDYQSLPKADLILVTHQHGDHLDLGAIGKIKKSTTKIICNPLSSANLPDAEVLTNGSDSQYEGIIIEAVPAYNIKHERSPGNPFHPRGEGNGYLLTLGDKRIYIAGDTENIPEMADLKNISVAFLPMNLPYTMTPEMVSEAVRMFNPEIVYPYHFGETNTDLLLPLVDTAKTEIRIRKLN